MLIHLSDAENIGNRHELRVAVDVHVRRISRYLGLTDPAAKTITDTVRQEIQDAWDRDIRDGGAFCPMWLSSIRLELWILRFGRLASMVARLPARRAARRRGLLIFARPAGSTNCSGQGQKIGRGPLGQQGLKRSLEDGGSEPSLLSMRSITRSPSHTMAVLSRLRNSKPGTDTHTQTDPKHRYCPPIAASAAAGAHDE